MPQQNQPRQPAQIEIVLATFAVSSGMTAFTGIRPFGAISLVAGVYFAYLLLKQDR
jgi:hypothetical protein